MNSVIFPTFCSSISTEWPFPLAIHNIASCHCTFDKNNFADTDYVDSHITLPDSLQAAINKRKAEYLAGRLCAREALKKFNYYGYPLSQEDKSPLWPITLCGSISHSQQIVAAIVSQRQDWQSLGLDIELLLDNQRSTKLLSTITNANEQQLIGDNLSLFTTLAFSIKESLFKALYPLTHKRFYFEHAEIINWSKNGQITLKLLIDLSNEWKKDCEISGQFSLRGHYLWSLISIPNKS